MQPTSFNYKIDKILSVKVVDLSGKETLLSIEPKEEWLARLPVEYTSPEKENESYEF